MSDGVLPASLLHDVIIAASARRPTISSSISADPTHLRSLSSSNDMDMVASSTVTPGGRSAALLASLKPRLGGMDGSIAGRKLGDSIEWGGVLSPASVNHHASAVSIPAKFSRSQTMNSSTNPRSVKIIASEINASSVPCDITESARLTLKFSATVVEDVVNFSDDAYKNTIADSQIVASSKAPISLIRDEDAVRNGKVYLDPISRVPAVLKLPLPNVCMLPSHVMSDHDKPAFSDRIVIVDADSEPEDWDAEIDLDESLNTEPPVVALASSLITGIPVSLVSMPIKHHDDDADTDADWDLEFEQEAAASATASITFSHITSSTSLLAPPPPAPLRSVISLSNMDGGLNRTSSGSAGIKDSSTPAVLSIKSPASAVTDQMSHLKSLLRPRVLQEHKPVVLSLSLSPTDFGGGVAIGGVSSVGTPFLPLPMSARDHLLAHTQARLHADQQQRSQYGLRQSHRLMPLLRDTSNLDASATVMAGSAAASFMSPAALAGNGSMASHQVSITIYPKPTQLYSVAADEDGRASFKETQLEQWLTRLLTRHVTTSILAPASVVGVSGSGPTTSVLPTGKFQSRVSFSRRLAPLVVTGGSSTGSGPVASGGGYMPLQTSAPVSNTVNAVNNSTAFATSVTASNGGTSSNAGNSFAVSGPVYTQAQLTAREMLRRERDEERDNLNALLNDQLPTLAGSLSIQAPEPPVLSPTECRPVIPSLPHALQHRAIAQWLRSCIRKISRLLQFKTESARKKSALFVIETINTLTEHVSEAERRYSVALLACPPELFVFINAAAAASNPEIVSTASNPGLIVGQTSRTLPGQAPIQVQALLAWRALSNDPVFPSVVALNAMLRLVTADQTTTVKNDPVPSLVLPPTRHVHRRSNTTNVSGFNIGAIAPPAIIQPTTGIVHFPLPPTNAVGVLVPSQVPTLPGFIFDVEGLVQTSDALIQLIWIASKLAATPLSSAPSSSPSVSGLCLSQSHFDHLCRGLHYCVPHLADRIELARTQSLAHRDGQHANRVLRTLVLLFARQAPHVLLPSVQKHRDHCTQQRIQRQKRSAVEYSKTMMHALKAASVASNASAVATVAPPRRHTRNLSIVATDGVPAVFDMGRWPLESHMLLAHAEVPMLVSGSAASSESALKPNIEIGNSLVSEATVQMALDSARVVYQVLSAMPQSSSFANNMAAGSGLGPKAGTVKTPYGQLDDAGIEIAPLPLAIDGDLEVAAGALCSLHLYCSHYSPLNTEPLRQSAMWDLDDEAYVWLDLAAQGSRPMHPSVPSLEACRELHQVPLGCGNWALGTVTAETIGAPRASGSSCQQPRGFYQCNYRPAQSSVANRPSLSSASSFAAFTASSQSLNVTFELEKLTWLLCGSPALRCALLKQLYVFLPHSFLRATCAYALSHYHLHYAPDTRLAESLLFEACLILDRIPVCGSYVGMTLLGFGRSVGRVSMPLVSWLGVNSLVAYGDMLLAHNKYRYAVLALEAGVLASRLARKPEQALTLSKRIGDITMEQRDWPRALRYHARLQARAKIAHQMNEFVYLSQQMSKIYVCLNYPTSAETTLLEALEFLNDSRRDVVAIGGISGGGDIYAAPSGSLVVEASNLPLHLHRGAQLALSLRLTQLHMENFRLDDAIHLSQSLLALFHSTETKTDSSGSGSVGISATSLTPADTPRSGSSSRGQSGGGHVPYRSALAPIGEESSVVSTGAIVGSAWAMPKDKALQVQLTLAKAFVMKRHFARATAVMDQIEREFDVNNAKEFNLSLLSHPSSPYQPSAWNDASSPRPSANNGSTTIPGHDRRFSITDGRSATGSVDHMSISPAMSPDFLLLRAKNAFHAMQIELALRYVADAQRATSSSSLSILARCHMLRGKILSTRLRYEFEQALAMHHPRLPPFASTASIFSPNSGGTVGLAATSPSSFATPSPLEVHPSGLDSALGHGLDSIAALENNSCDAGVRCALPPVPRSTLLRLMPDPRPTVDAFTLAYQYFRKVDDNYRAAKVLAHIVQSYLQCIFPLVAQLGYPLCRLVQWLQKNDFDVSDLRALSTADLQFELQYSNATPKAPLSEFIGSLSNKRCNATVSFALPSPTAHTTKSSRLFMEDDDDNNYDTYDTDGGSALLRVPDPITTHSRAASIVSATSTDNAILDMTPASVASRTEESWLTRELSERYDAADSERRRWHGARACMARLEQPAVQALEVSLELMSVPLLLVSLLNMAELRFLQGLPAASQSSWNEACELMLSLFFHAMPCVESQRRLLSRMPLSLLLKLHRLFQRLLRLMFCYQRPEQTQHVLLLDLYLMCDAAIQTHLNTPLSTNDTGEIAEKSRAAVTSGSGASTPVNHTPASSIATASDLVGASSTSTLLSARDEPSGRFRARSSAPVEGRGIGGSAVVVGPLITVTSDTGAVSVGTGSGVKTGASWSNRFSSLFVSSNGANVGGGSMAMAGRAVAMTALASAADMQTVDGMQVPRGAIEFQAPALHQRRILHKRFSSNAAAATVPSSSGSSSGNNGNGVRTATDTCTATNLSAVSTATVVSLAEKIAICFHQMEVHCKQYGQGKISQTETREKNLSWLRRIYRFVQQIRVCTAPPLSYALRQATSTDVESHVRGLLRSTLPVFLYSATFPDSALSLSRPIVADSDSSVSLSTVAIDARPPSSVHTLDASLMEYACERDHRQHCLAAPNLLYCVSLDNAVYIYTPFANTDAGRISMWLSPALPFQPEFSAMNAGVHRGIFSTLTSHRVAPTLTLPLRLPMGWNALLATAEHRIGDLDYDLELPSLIPALESVAVKSPRSLSAVARSKGTASVASSSSALFMSDLALGTLALGSVSASAISLQRSVPPSTWQWQLAMLRHRSLEWASQRVLLLRSLRLAVREQVRNSLGVPFPSDVNVSAAEMRDTAPIVSDTIEILFGPSANSDSFNHPLVNGCSTELSRVMLVEAALLAPVNLDEFSGSMIRIERQLLVYLCAYSLLRDDNNNPAHTESNLRGSLAKSDLASLLPSPMQSVPSSDTAQTATGLLASPSFRMLLSHMPAVFAGLIQPPTLLMATVRELFRSLDPQNILVLMAALLAEQSVVLASAQPSRCAAVIASLLQLFSPFRLQHLVIPLLPRQALGLMGLATVDALSHGTTYSAASGPLLPAQPFLIGLAADLLNSVSLPAVVIVVHLDYNNVQYRTGSFPLLPPVFKNRLYKVLIRFMSAVFIKQQQPCASSSQQPPSALLPSRSSSPSLFNQPSPTVRAANNALGSFLTMNTIVPATPSTKAGSGSVAESPSEFSSRFLLNDTDPYLSVSSVFSPLSSGCCVPMMPQTRFSGVVDSGTMAADTTGKAATEESYSTETGGHVALARDDAKVLNELAQGCHSLFLDIIARYLLFWRPPSLARLRLTASPGCESAAVRYGLDVQMLLDHTHEDQRVFLRHFLGSGILCAFLESRLLAMYLLSPESCVITSSPHIEPSIHTSALGQFYFERQARQRATCRFTSSEAICQLELAGTMRFSRNFNRGHLNYTDKLKYTKRWVVLQASQLSIFKSKKDPLPEHIYPLQPGFVRVINPMATISLERPVATGDDIPQTSITENVKCAAGEIYDENDYPFELHFKAGACAGLLHAHEQLRSRREAQRGFFDFELFGALDQDQEREACGVDATTPGLLVETHAPKESYSKPATSTTRTSTLPAPLCFLADSEDLQQRWCRALRARVLHPRLREVYMKIQTIMV